MSLLSCNTVSIFGLPMHPMRQREAVEAASEAVASRGKLLFGMVNAAKLVGMRRHASLFRAVVAADVILADGMSIVIASRLLGAPLPERVAGIDLMRDLLERADEERWRVYFLGAREEVLEEAIRRVRRDHPGLAVAGHHHGYFEEAEEERLVSTIRESRPDILFVGMGSPKKERFLAKWADESGASVCHGVGGSFDVLAGRVGRAPRAFQVAGFEWLWRVGQEPKRLWRRYLVTNTAFSLMVAEALLSKVLPAHLRGVEDSRWLPWSDPDGQPAGAHRPVASLEDVEDLGSLGAPGEG